MIKDRIKQVIAFLTKNWYASILTVGSFLIGIEVLGTWAGFGIPFLLIFGYAIYTITKS
jgi:hypothetical protein